MTRRAALVLVAALAAGCAGASSSDPIAAEEARSAPEPPSGAEMVSETPSEEVARALDDDRCAPCEEERIDCDRLGWDDCGTRWSRCRERCLALARTADVTPGAACSDEARCATGLCCHNGACVRNRLVYFPLEPQTSDPVRGDDPSPVRGTTSMCALLPLQEERAGGSPLVRSLRRQRETFRRCFDRGADQPALGAPCVCEAACGLRLDLDLDRGEPGGVTTVRYPFVEVDGLELTIDAEGRVTRCRYSRLGAPEESVDRTCD